jgi:N,N'-diacetyllegionaminate synthase
MIRHNNHFCTFSEVYLIAEIGVNHNGDMNLAKKMIEAAKESGADAVKFQTFSADLLVSQETQKVEYQKQSGPQDETHYEMIKKLEMSKDDHYDLFNFCYQVGIDFISTPYDLESAKFLNKLGVKYFKTASADIIDIPLLKYIASTGKPTIIATGMASLGEIEKAVEVFENSKNLDFALLHCVSNYPCSNKSLNMRVMNALENSFDCPVGYSDHSIGFLASVIAVSLGARVIEKHFTLDKMSQGPDHMASSTPDEFHELSSNIRRAEMILGSSRKKLQNEEFQMSKVSRKTLIASRDIEIGEVIKISDLSLMRTDGGISATFMDSIIGLCATKSILRNQKIGWGSLS